jgi:hypothetical protein
MVKLNKSIRQPRSVDDVMQEVNERAPHLVDNCFIDRDWIWVCSVDLRGTHNEATRTALKEIGFRFSPGGHIMPDGVTRGHWGHSCQKPTGVRRKPAHPKNRITQEDPADMLRSLGL